MRYEAGAMVEHPLLAEVVRRLSEQFGLEKIILFGSQARRTAADHSDIDLLVIAPLHDAGLPRREMLTAMYHALMGLRIGIDLVLMTPDEFALERRMPGSVARPASQEGRVVYERAA